MMEQETKYFIRISQSYVTHNSAQKQVSLLESEINNVLITGEDKFKSFISDLQERISAINAANKRCKDIPFKIYDCKRCHCYIIGSPFNWACSAGYSFYVGDCFIGSVYVVKKEL